MDKKVKEMIFWASVLFIILAAFVSMGFTEEIDVWFYAKLSLFINEGRTHIVKIITTLGSGKALITLSILLLFMRGTRREYGVPAVITVACSSWLNGILKMIFARERPSILPLVQERSFSFPSGHAANNMAFISIIILLLWAEAYKSKDRPRQKGAAAMTVTACVWVALVGLSRVYLGVHYISDVVAGYAIGFALAGAIYLIIQKEAGNRSV